MELSNVKIKNVQLEKGSKTEGQSLQQDVQMTNQLTEGCPAWSAVRETHVETRREMPHTPPGGLSEKRHNPEFRQAREHPAHFCICRRL